MAGKSIPVYDICSIRKGQGRNDDFLADRFSHYLEEHYAHLHFPHRHSFYHMVLFTEGRGTHTIDFDRFPVEIFQLYFMIPGQAHSWHFEGRTDGYIINFSPQFFASFLLNQHYLDRFSFFSGISQEGVCKLPATIRKEAVQLFEAILPLSAGAREEQQDMIRALLLQLFLLVEDSLSGQRSKSVPQQKQMLLKGFRKLIEMHYRSIRLPKEYADLLYITPNHLNALCQDLLGKTAGELIRDRVLLEAKRLLTNAALTATEIAYELNFQDNSYFTRFFKKYAGVTPDEFRKQFQIENQRT